MSKPLTETEIAVVRLRYFEGLHSRAIAEKLGLTVGQVKYIFRTSRAREYIRTTAVPELLNPILSKVDKCLANPAASYIAQLRRDFDATTYVWDDGKKHEIADNRKRMQALKKYGRILGITHDQKNFRRDFNKAVAKHIAWLEQFRAKIVKALETGKIRFY